MTNMKKYGRKGFINLESVKDKPFRGTIAEVTPENQFGRPVLHFEGGAKFSLNVTNTEIVLNTYGEESKDWVGHVVELYPGMLPNTNGGEKEGVRLRPISLPEHYGDGGDKGTAATPVARKKIAPQPDFGEETPPSDDPSDPFRL
jgi:hypothetical protein